jgi:hypothetical protein
MFGLTEQEMDFYRTSVTDFAVEDITPQIVSNAKIMTPIVTVNGERIPNKPYVIKLVSDLEEIIVLTATHMAYEYAYLQAESKMVELEIIKFLHLKYEDSLLKYFIKIGIVCTSDVITEIIGEIILELPWLYSRAMDEDKFNVEEFLEEKLEAYNDYMNENFNEMSDPDDEDDWDEDLDEEDFDEEFDDEDEDFDE